MSRDAHLLAQIMCQLTKSIVWPHVKAITESHGHQLKGPLVTRSGSGVKTYHTQKTVNGRNSHVITYGKKMLEKKKDFSAVPYVLTGREIKEKGFYNGDLSYKNLVAHTVIHESAHAIQNATGHRHRNEVHNRAFYALLRELYNACGEEVAQELEKAAMKQGVSLDFNPETYEVNQEGKLTDTLAEIRKHQGYAVSIRGSRCLAVVTAVGDTKSDILIYEGQHEGASYKASNRILKPLSSTDRQPDPEKDIPKPVAWIPGGYCHFYGSNKTYYGGHIQKVNPKKCVVKITEGPAKDIGGRVDVPKSMLKEGNREFPKQHSNQSQSRSSTFDIR